LNPRKEKREVRYRTYDFIISTVTQPVPANEFLRDQACDSEEVVTALMLDGTYLSRNFATLGPLT
jgi:hypothetical protein